MAVKGSQQNLYDAIIDYFVTTLTNNPLCLMQQNETVDLRHGRVEIRRGCLDMLPNPELERATHQKTLTLFVSNFSVKKKPKIVKF